ncbi:MAG: DUF4139 domain-containing protein [Nitrosomonas sp.]|nr:DUF4139 domain-containing protein [Nitrosomonas sp.]MBK7364789.1 DUF4139 domain-containing protein [Nitrosomonas sp.]
MSILSGNPSLLAAEKITTSQDQESIAVTIYNENMALVKDSRNVELIANTNQLAWREVSALIRPETALLRNQTSQSNFHILEQNFDFDLLTPQKLLEKHVGKEISVVRTNSATGIETSEMAVILSTNEGIVLKFNDRIETGVPGRMVFPAVPENLRDKPTLLLLLHSPEAGKHKLELSYLTGGLSWRADYVAALNEDDSKLDLNGLVTLTNQSGVTYPQARLQLVAGDVNRIQSEQRMGRKMAAMSAEMADVAQMKEESFFEYHLYTLQRPTTLAENQTKQVALMSASQIPVNKVFLLQGADYYYSGKYGVLGQKLKTSVLINFDNKGEQLGIPLPKGIVRVYKKDAQGHDQFIGEDQIDHTPKNEQIRLKLGNAFDITADKIQTDFQQIAGSIHQTSIFETAYQITIRNAKKESVVVQVQEPIPGDWLVVSESLKHKKLSAHVVEWKIPVPAEGEATLTYRVRVKY